MDKYAQYSDRHSDFGSAVSGDMAPSRLKGSKIRSHDDVPYRQHVRFWAIPFNCKLIYAY